MARKVRHFPKGYQSRQRYDWDKWLDGNVWELKPGTDFVCTSQGFANAARDYAKRHKIKMKVSAPSGQAGKVFLQAIK